jgi:hypothetical protein
MDDRIDEIAGRSLAFVGAGRIRCHRRSQDPLARLPLKPPALSGLKRVFFRLGRTIDWANPGCRAEGCVWILPGSK